MIWIHSWKCYQFNKNLVDFNLKLQICTLFLKHTISYDAQYFSTKRAWKNQYWVCKINVYIKLKNMNCRASSWTYESWELHEYLKSQFEFRLLLKE